MVLKASKSDQEKIFVDSESLSKLAIYLSGVKDGKGNLSPLGTIVLDDLWNAILYLRGDVRYFSERDERHSTSGKQELT